MRSLGEVAGSRVASISTERRQAGDCSRPCAASSWWRMSPRPGRLVLMSRANAIPLWRQRVSFEHGLELESLDDAHWRAFSFELPDGLPPAVEARSIAWRYEVEARRSVRIGPDDRALITPLASVNVLASPRADRSPIRTAGRSSATSIAIDALAR